MPKDRKALVELPETLEACLQDAFKLKHSWTFGKRYDDLRDQTIAHMALLIKRTITGGVTPFLLRKIGASIKYINDMVKAGRTKLSPLHLVILELARLPQLVKDQEPSWQFTLCCKDAENLATAR